MKILLLNMKLFDFTALDQQIEKFRELRDSYRTANVAHYGKNLAKLLDE